MTAATAMIQPTTSQLAAAEMHLSRRDQWVYCRANGKAIIVMPSSDGKRLYYVGQRGECCTCTGSRHYPICSHRIAAANAASIDALVTYMADAADDLLEEYAFQRESDLMFAGFERVEVEAAPALPVAAPVARKGYAALFPDNDDVF